MARKKLSDEEKKSKINLVINENLLEKIDKLLEKDGNKRSRLIEQLLQDYIEKNKDKF